MKVWISYLINTIGAWYSKKLIPAAAEISAVQDTEYKEVK